MKAYEGLRCPKGKHNPCASLEVIRGDTCHKMIGLGQGQDGVNKGGSRLINAHECFIRAFIACKRDGMEGETLLLVRNS